MELDENRTIESLTADELAFLNKGLLNNFERSLWVRGPDLYDLIPIGFCLTRKWKSHNFNDLLPVTRTVIQIWNHCENLFNLLS